MAAPMLMQAVSSMTGGKKPSMLPLFYAGAQAVNSLVKRRQAKGMFPNLYDNLQVEQMNDLQSEIDRLKSGTAYAPEMDALGQQAATISTGIDRTTGGAGGASIGSRLRLARTMGSAMGDVVQRGSDRIAYYRGALGSVVGDMAKRRLMLDEWRYAQKMAEAAQAGKEAKTNLMGFLASTGAGQGFTPPTQPTPQTQAGGIDPNTGKSFSEVASKTTARKSKIGGLGAVMGVGTAPGFDAFDLNPTGLPSGGWPEKGNG